MFPFGAGEGDTFLPIGERANSGEISLHTDFTFFGVQYDRLYVSFEYIA